MSSEKYCTGEGHCLKVRSYDNLCYSKYECQYNCQPIECPNFKFCHSMRPLWYLNHGGGICIQCSSFIDTFYDNYVHEKSLYHFSKLAEDEKNGIIRDTNGTIIYNINDFFTRKTLIFREDLECSVCYETKLNVKLPKCDHSLCISCAKEIYSVKNTYHPETHEHLDNIDPINPKCPLCRG